MSCHGVSVAYVPGVWVLRDISFALQPGTVTAVVGENGAGKSTLYRVMAGMQKPTRGRVTLAPANGSAPSGASSQPVAYVPQELMPVPDLKVYENLFLGDERKAAGFLADRRAMVRETAADLERLGLSVDPRARAGSLSVAEQQVLEIAKSVRRVPRVWILDEPTSSLGSKETERLFELIAEHKRRGAAIVYTTHRMEEIRRVADRVLVLRDGTLVLDRPAGDITEDQLVAAMLGAARREMHGALPSVPSDADTALEVTGLRVPGLAGEFSFRVRRGEVLGIAGLVGSGRTELLEAVYGARRSTGTVRIGKVPVRRNNPAASISGGMVLVPEDRKGKGLILDLSILDNHTLSRLDLFGKLVRQDHKRREASRGAAEATLLRGGGLKDLVARLSGGNQQKVLLGRALIGTVNVLLLDEPTRGVDIGARSELYASIRRLLDRGMGILLVSSDQDEIANIAHRVLVMRAGTIVAELEGDAGGANLKESILRHSLGYDA